jgi:formylmethanofuran dehydrogenase subunit B
MVISNQNQKKTNHLSLADICADKGYVCHDLEIPNEDEFLSTGKILDINNTEFLLNYIDYRILLNELEEICSLVGISQNKALSRAITLLEIYQKAENNKKTLAIIDSENNISPIKI